MTASTSPSAPRLEVWVFLPHGRAIPDVERIRHALRAICVERTWSLQERRTVMLGGRPTLTGEDAENLYRRLHRVRVAVLSVQARQALGPLILRRPPRRGHESRIHWRDSISLRQFCRHKALFHRLRLDRDSQSWAPVFSSWADRIECEGSRDPRCLPLHVFETDRAWSKRLLHLRGREDFDDKHRGDEAVNDARGFAWRTGPNHGREVLAVAGRSLPDGFLWDVQSGGRELELWTPTAGWMVRQYANVSPDANVRAREPFAKPIRLR